MNKYILIIISVIALLCLIFIIKDIKDKEQKTSKELEFTYEINAGIPFKRVYEIEDDSVVGFVKSYVVKDENTNGKVGASVYTNYVFKGLKEGETTITFKVVSITGEYEDSQIEVHNVIVDKDLNISLVKGINDEETAR